MLWLIILGSVFAYLLIAYLVMWLYARYLVKNDMWESEAENPNNQYLVPICGLLWPILPAMIFLYAAWVRFGNSQQLVRTLKLRYLRELNEQNER